MICFHPHALHGAPRCLPRIGLPAMIRLLPKLASSPRAWIHVSVTLLFPFAMLILIRILQLFLQFLPYNKCPWQSRNQRIIRILVANLNTKAINSKRYVPSLSLPLFLSRSNTCSHSCRFRNRLARAWSTPANWSRTTWRVSMRTSGRSSVSKGHKDAAAYTHKK